MNQHLLPLLLAIILGFGPSQPIQAASHEFVCGDYSQNKIFIINDTGKVLWEHPAPHVCDLWALSNGNFLYSAWHGVQEVNRDKKVVMEYTTTSEVFSCQRLADGNTLVGETTLGRLTIVDPQGKLVREIPILQPGEKGSHGYIANVRQEANGHFLVSSYFHDWVREFDSSGKLLREIPAFSGGRSVVRLANGHLLISTSQLKKDPRLFEIDADGKVVWEISNRDLPEQPFRMICGIHRLPNGNTLLANFTGHANNREANAAAKVPHLMEITPDKKIVWSFAEYGGEIKSITCVQRLDDVGEKALR